MLPSSITILGLASTALLINGEITSKQAMDIVMNLVNSYLCSRNAEVAASVNSILFAEDVKGPVDVSTIFDGRELATRVRDHSTSPLVQGIHGNRFAVNSSRTWPNE
ncbi:hypothetical protein I203_108595 [Kwoniella mangroviensis CBS 8507]|uniref:hypothetical protein n=1 Tax=Kwoniella mangroviensis CBS 8507 TaxID=1296122 RepID=UPI00304EBED5